MMKIIAMCCITWLGFSAPAAADYNRNEAVPVQKVLFGSVTSVRHITEHELIDDRRNGWKVFGGALIGGTIGNQFGSGSGRAINTILGAMIGGSLADGGNTGSRQVAIQLVELMITVEDGSAYMVVQELDPNMVFQAQDSVRMIYLADGSVRIDKQM